MGWDGLDGLGWVGWVVLVGLVNSRMDRRDRQPHIWTSCSHRAGGLGLPPASSHGLRVRFRFRFRHTDRLLPWRAPPIRPRRFFSRWLARFRREARTVSTLEPVPSLDSPSAPPPHLIPSHLAFAFASTHRRGRAARHTHCPAPAEPYRFWGLRFRFSIDGAERGWIGPHVLIRAVMFVSRASVFVFLGIRVHFFPPSHPRKLGRGLFYAQTRPSFDFEFSVLVSRAGLGAVGSSRAWRAVGADGTGCAFGGLFEGGGLRGLARGGDRAFVWMRFGL